MSTEGRTFSVVKNSVDVENVVAVVITYQPDLDELGAVLRATSPQVGATVLVDNGSGTDLAAWTSQQRLGAVTTIPLGKNLGIAAAQNEGIRFARQQRAEYVLLLDQDSIPEPDMVRRLLEAVVALPNTASVGPSYVDARQRMPAPFLRVEGLRLRRCVCERDDAVVPTDHLIASGCLIPLSAIDIVGQMREDLFIDYVDTEWGLRARRYGLQSYGVCGAKMQHSLGNAPIVILGRKFALHSPLRHYYRFRNAVILYREIWIPWNWKLVDGYRLLLRYGFYALCARPRWERFRMMTRGLIHGLMGRTGQYQP
jgi:rhamnosyltransferase